MAEIFIFFAFLLFFVFLPPVALYLLLHRGRGGTDLPVLIFVGCCLAVGIVIFVVTMYIFRFAGIGFIPLLILPIVSVLLVFYLTKIDGIKEIRKILPRFQKKSISMLSIILIGMIAQGIILFPGGQQTGDEFIFPSVHDTMWNVALTTELYYHFPPQHPGMAGEALKNNHYFYPFFLAGTHALTGISFLDLYYRYGPLLVSFLFGIGLYAVGSVLTSRTLFQGLAIFLGYFSGSGAFVLPLFLGMNFDWKWNSLFADQPYDQILNPYSVLGFAFILFAAYCLHMYFQARMRNALWFIFAGLLLGVLYGFKSFGGIIGVLSLAATAAFAYILYREKAGIFLFLFSLALFLPVFFIITELSVSSMSWAPGWILTEMMVGIDKLNLPEYAQIESYYHAIGNTKGLIKIKTVEFLIYIFGNFGTRILGLGFLIYLLMKRIKPSAKKILHLFSLFGVLIAIMIPLLFNLGGNSFNIIQFTPYAFVFLALYLAVFCERMYMYFNGRNKPAFGVVILLLIIALSVPVNVKNVIAKVKGHDGRVPADEFNALSYLKSQDDKNDVVLVDVKTVTLEDPIYISALSEHRLFFSSENFARQTGIDPANRVGELNDFFRGEPSDNFLGKYGITYIYCIKPFSDGWMQRIGNEATLRVAYENDSVIIYQVVK